LTDQDINFLIEQFSKITCSFDYELPSEFVERVRSLTSDLTPFPGKFSFDRFPYFRKIIDLFHPSDPTREVILMKGNQLGGTTGIVDNIILYNIMVVPKSQICISAGAGLMKTGVSIRIEKMLDSTGARGLIFSQGKKSKGSRDTGDTANAKEYPGGYLHFYGSGSGNKLRQNTYHAALGDEVGSYPHTIKGEGDVIDLIRNRTDAFDSKRKIYFGSTPLIKQTSRIEKLFLDGDQEKYFVPCKHCGEMQELVWHGKTEDGEEYGVVWENDENFNPKIGTVGYKCPYCGGIMRNYDKVTIIPKGEWRPTAKSKNPYVKSFHLSPLYNPPGMLSWESMVLLWAECWDIEHNRVKDKEKYRTFRNTKQGLTFEESGVQIRYERAILFRRSGFARGHVPNTMAIKDSGSPILIVVASVDVQKNCLYVDVKGYSVQGITWTLDFFPIDGDTADFNGPWDKLEEYIENARFISDDKRTYRIAITLIDSGWNTEYVYAFSARYPSGVYACKGVDYIRAGETYKIFDKGTLDRIGLPLAYHVNTTKMKDRISNSMSVLTWNDKELQPAWYCNFPEDFRDDYFKMFEVEDRVDEYDQYDRYKRTIWKPKHMTPNHAFDTYGYNMAALEIFADAYCREELELPGLDWPVFWELAKNGEFIEP
jgi:phage terminase large subunit GpA-like protein